MLLACGFTAQLDFTAGAYDALPKAEPRAPYEAAERRLGDRAG